MTSSAAVPTAPQAAGDALALRSRAGTSPWAVASLLCSIAVCCPPVSLIGVLLGVRAIVQISAQPSMRGRNLALAGITIGILMTIGWIGGAFWWHFNARIPMQIGPREELTAGLSGDLAQFKAGFTGAGATASDAEAAAFINEIRSRYGRLQHSSQSAVSSTTAPMAGPTEYRIPYALQFDVQSVEAEAVFVTFSPASAIPQPVFKWRWLRLIDPKRGDLIYPLSAAADATGTTQPPPQP